MAVVLSDFCDCLSAHGEIRILGNRQTPVYALEKLSSQKENFAPDTLYIGALSELTLPVRSGCFALACDLPQPTDADWGDANVIIFEGEKDILLRELTVRHRELRKGEALAGLFSSAFFDGSDIQKLIELAAKELGRELSVGNADLQLLCTSFICSEKLSWQDLVNKGIVPPVGSLYSSNPAASKAVWTDAIDQEGLFYVIDNNGQSAFFSVGTSPVPLSIADQIALDALSRIIASILNQSISPSVPHWIQYEQLLIHLIEGSVQDNSILAYQAQRIGQATEGIFELFMIDLSLQRLSSTRSSELRTALQTHFKTERSALYGGMLLLLRDCSKQEAADLDYGELNAYLGTLNIRGFKSGPFRNLLELRYIYQTMLGMFRLAFCMDSSRHLFSLVDVEHFVLVDAAIRQGSLEGYCHPIVRELVIADMQNNGFYIETLTAYLQCNQKAIDASKMLHIHRNTLDYRLNKLNALVDIDWNDGKLIFCLQFSLYMLEYYKAMEINIGRDISYKDALGL